MVVCCCAICTKEGLDKEDHQYRCLTDQAVHHTIQYFHQMFNHPGHKRLPGRMSRYYHSRSRLRYKIKILLCESCQRYKTNGKVYWLLLADMSEQPLGNKYVDINLTCPPQKEQGHICIFVLPWHLYPLRPQHLQLHRASVRRLFRPVFRSTRGWLQNEDIAHCCLQQKWYLPYSLKHVLQHGARWVLTYLWSSYHDAAAQLSKNSPVNNTPQSTQPQ